MSKIIEWVTVEIDGRPKQVSIIRDMTAEEIADRIPPLADAKQAALEKVLRWCDQVAERVTRKYVAAEVAAWGAKAADARLVIASGTVSAMLQTEADELGVTPAVLAAKILIKAAQYETLIAKLAAVRQKAEVQFEAAADHAELQTAMQALRAGMPAE
jgi:hypothetical protein